ncbi:MAG: Type 1 glutamine amidotransferase-like domain-containing protein [Nanoarchaeota archaeon]
MTGKLFLSGGGNEKQTYEIDEIFLQGINSILYIPWAWPNDDFESCEEWINNSMNQHKKVKITTTKKIELPEKMKKYDAIYIGGGNTFKLLKMLRDTGLDKELIKLYEDGKTIYGGSAGTLIWGFDIKTSLICSDKDKNLVKIKNTNGLNKIANRDLQVHFNRDQILEHQEYSKKTDRSIIAIPEESALLVTENRFKVIGEKPITYITKNEYKDFKPNSFILL